ncbi:hypothetical protein OG21DRAFT_1527189 [Imleria badia]|nr:hypothetical protein OG21DRAFT_1527189 [Imleria badia]
MSSSSPLVAWTQWCCRHGTILTVIVACIMSGGMGQGPSSSTCHCEVNRGRMRNLIVVPSQLGVVGPEGRVNGMATGSGMRKGTVAWGGHVMWVGCLCCVLGVSKTVISMSEKGSPQSYVGRRTEVATTKTGMLSTHRHKLTIKRGCVACRVVHHPELDNLGLGKNVGDHFTSGAENELDFAIVDDPTYEVKAHIDVLGARMVLMVFHERNRRLVVQEEGGWLRERGEQAGDEGTKPVRFFCSMCSTYVFTLGHRERNNLLLLGAPGNSATVDEKASGKKEKVW